MKAAVVGASGFAGGEVLKALSNHPDLQIGTLCAGQSAGKRLGEFHPQLPELASWEIQPVEIETLAAHDLIVFALPHTQSAQIAQQLRASGCEAILIDCGADHRLTNAADWEEYYGTAFTPPWTYGMPELLHAGETQAETQRSQLRNTKEIAVPGCNVTAVTLALQPAVHAGLIEPDDIVATLAVGYSGAGKSLKSHLLAVSAFGNAQPYSVGGSHRHIPEIKQNLVIAGADAAKIQITFTPVLVPMSRGILATVTAQLKPGVSATQIEAAYRTSYSAEPLIRLLPAGIWPQTLPVTGSANVEVQANPDCKSGKLIALAALDNLGKGTAQAAVQSANLALGYPELTGLTTLGTAP